MRKIWIQEEVEILVKMYPDHFAQEIAEQLGRSERAVHSKANSLGLKSNKEKYVKAGLKGCISEKAIATRYQKGHASSNKGQKISPELYERLKPTMFKKGSIPHNKKPIGTEVINDDGYIMVKVANPDKWQLKHRIVWEQVHGEIPEGYNIQFKNRNRLDCRLENLYIIKRSEQMRTENSYIAKYPKPLQEIIRLKGVLNRLIHKFERNGNK